MNTQPIGPFLGINNRLPDFALHVEKRGDYLRAADNVDIDNAGSILRRNGKTLIQAMSGAHSLWKSKDGTRRYLVRASVLYAVTLPAYSETLLKILASDAPMSYVEFNGDVYFSNGTDSGRIDNAGAVYPWGMEAPAQTTVTEISGLLHAGTYQIALTYFNATTGEESGHVGSINPTLLNSGGFRVALPAGVTGATHINVYISSVNGSEPCLHSSVAVGTASVDIDTPPTTTRVLATTYAAPLPAGTRIFMHMGRLCAVAGNFVYYGLPFRPGYYDPVGGFIRFEQPVTAAVPAQNGVYIASTVTQWFAGDLGAPEMILDVLPYGAVPGTEFEFTHNSRVGWMGAKGFVTGDTQGQVDASMSDNVDPTLPAAGFSYLLEDRGYRRVVSCGYCMNVETGAVTTYSGLNLTSASGDYGTDASGVCALTGTSDAGAETLTTIGLGKQNFGAENEKRMPAAYVGAASENPLLLRIQTPKGDDYTYPARACSDRLNIERIDPGKGLRANWFELTIYNQGGSDLTLASVSFAPTASTRRI